MFNKLTEYLKGTKAEMSHVNWPTRSQTVNFTILVIGVSVAVSFFLGIFDRMFEFILNKFVL